MHSAGPKPVGRHAGRLAIAWPFIAAIPPRRPADSISRRADVMVEGGAPAIAGMGHALPGILLSPPAARLTSRSITRTSRYKARTPAAPVQGHRLLPRQVEPEALSRSHACYQRHTRYIKSVTLSLV